MSTNQMSLIQIQVPAEFIVKAEGTPIPLRWVDRQGKLELQYLVKYLKDGKYAEEYRPIPTFTDMQLEEMQKQIAALKAQLEAQKAAQLKAVQDKQLATQGELLKNAEAVGDNIKTSHDGKGNYTTDFIPDAILPKNKAAQPIPLNQEFAKQTDVVDTEVVSDNG